MIAHGLSGLIAGCIAMAAVAQARDEAGPPVAWTEPMAPFRITENIYYVGTKGIAAYLLTSPQGHILIDGGLPANAAIIERNIATLGFKLSDVRHLLINHAHYDHAGGLAKLKRDTGATLWAGAGDVPDLESGRNAGRPELGSFPSVKVDHKVRDGEMLKLGPITMKAIATPGHTKGCTSWQTSAAGKSVLFACSFTVAGQNLIDDPQYRTAAADFRATFAKLRKMKADIFLTFHPEFFNMDRKLARRKSGDANAFVDPGEFGRVISASKAAFVKEIDRQKAARAAEK
ncbi:MAG: subclass B3 metallo-beta-lactamase [Sphingobium sp.]